MRTLYVLSTESFSGKTSLCYGIASHLKKDGVNVGYFKPLVFYGRKTDGRTISEDADFMKESLGLKDDAGLLAPVVLDDLAIENAAAGKPNDYADRISDAFERISAGKDVIVVEGATSLTEGALVGLPPHSIADRLYAHVLTVCKYNNDLAADGIIAGQALFGKRLIGTVLNEIPRPRLEFVEETVAPMLASRGIHPFAVLPLERILLSMTVKEIADALGAEVLGPSDRGQELVENLMVGAMSMDSALSYFRRKPNKAVITGGDRADIQLAALETSTRCLVLTGNITPSPLILGRAEELGIPLLIAKQDTLGAIEIIQQYFGKIRLHQPRKVERFESLLQERFDFARLYSAMGLK